MGAVRYGRNRILCWRARVVHSSHSFDGDRVARCRTGSRVYKADSIGISMT